VVLFIRLCNIMVDVSMLCTSKYAVREESLPVAIVCLSCSQERGYVVKSGRTLVPTPLGRLLTAYLTIHFTEYVDVNFTAKVEEQLDEVSGAVATFCVRGVGGAAEGWEWVRQRRRERGGRGGNAWYPRRLTVCVSWLRHQKMLICVLTVLVLGTMLCCAVSCAAVRSW
jgi:hypothetical protein